MFDLGIMDRVSVKGSVNFIGCNVIICLHKCGHTKNVVGHTIAFKICQIYTQWFFSDNLVLSVLFFAVSCCIWKFLELLFSVQYSCHFHQCQVHPFFSFVQYSPDVGAIVFHELPPLLTLVLPTLMFLFLYLEADCLANRILSYWIWLVRLRISTSFSYFLSHCPYLTNSSYLVTMLRMKSSRSIFLPSSYFSWKHLM